MPDYFAFFDDQATGRQLYFSEPERIIEICDPNDIDAAFADIERALANGFYIAGYLAYELGFALEPTLQSRLSPNRPLIHLGIFKAPSDTPPSQLLYTAKSPDLSLKPSWSEEDYLRRFEKTQAYIEAGDCYQINLTFPMTGEIDARAEAIYAAFRKRQPGRYGALLRLGGADIMSFSPELFFERKGQETRMRPMKGTRPRGAGDDTHIAEAMRAEPKSQAENLMIVDLLRNDLSRLAEVGSVKVPELFALEAYPTLFQMTSQVTATLREDVRWLDIFKGLFPCGSVTGAPKIRAMEIIDDLEDRLRGPYCGAIGFIEPNGDACFNVAIRTAVLEDGVLTYNVGSGVVYDSDGADEYRECLLKADLLNRPAPHLIETLYWSPEEGYRHGQAHLDRLRKSSGNSGIELPPPPKANLPQHIRWICEDGSLSCETKDYKALNTPIKAALSQYALDADLQRFDVKTSHRDFYDGERARLQALHPDIHEVIFLNERGELTEGSFTSLFIERDGALLTPPLSSGLLPGVLRQKLIKNGTAKEAVLELNDLMTADMVYLGNSLRGLMPAEILSHTPL